MKIIQDDSNENEIFRIFVIACQYGAWVLPKGAKC